MNKRDYRLEAIDWADEAHKARVEGDKAGAINLYRQAWEYARKGNAPILAKVLNTHIELLSV